MSAGACLHKRPLLSALLPPVGGTKRAGGGCPHRPETRSLVDGVYQLTCKATFVTRPAMTLSGRKRTVLYC